MQYQPKAYDPPRDIKIQGIVLTEALHRHLKVGRDQFICGLAGGSRYPATEQQYLWAIQDLESIGLLEYNLPVVCPTRAAQRFNEFLDTIA
jgi:hypothetical protein